MEVNSLRSWKLKWELKWTLLLLVFYSFTFLLFYHLTLLPFKAIVQHEELNFLFYFLFYSFFTPY
jgi:hypothetical protein